MALTRTLSDFTYRSGSGGVFYYFTIGMDQTGNLSVKDIQTPNGRVVDQFTSIPESVTDDIRTALNQVENLVAQTSAVNGQLVFTGETSKTVTFVTPFVGTSYRVVLSQQDFIPLRITGKTTTGFVVEAGVTYTGTVGFDVFA